MLSALLNQLHFWNWHWKKETPLKWGLHIWRLRWSRQGSSRAESSLMEELGVIGVIGLGTMVLVGSLRIFERSDGCQNCLFIVIDLNSKGHVLPYKCNYWKLMQTARMWWCIVLILIGKFFSMIKWTMIITVMITWVKALAKCFRKNPRLDSSHHFIKIKQAMDSSKLFDKPASLWEWGTWMDVC